MAVRIRIFSRDSPAGAQVISFDSEQEARAWLRPRLDRGEIEGFALEAAAAADDDAGAGGPRADAP